MNNIFIEYLPPWVETGLQPAFYDKESGTVLQQTARMYAKVNELTKAFNDLSEETKATVEEYITKFVELHDYVEDYFTNLDVQEEINNKLDDMVEAGTLQEIITTYIQANVAWTFDTVADMKLATNLVDGSFARTLGFRSINDGGGALYKISDTGTANEMDVIAVGDLYATLVMPTLASPEMFGAYGDGGVHDDTLYLQRCCEISKNILFKHDYQISDMLVLTSGTTLDGGNYTITNNSDVTFIRSSGVNNVVVKNLNLVGDGSLTISQAGLHFLSTTNLTIKNVKIENTGGDGIIISESKNCRVEDAILKNNLISVFSFNSSFITYQNIHVTKPRFKYGLQFKSCQHCNMVNVTVDTPQDNGIMISKGSEDYAEENYDNTLTNVIVLNQGQEGETQVSGTKNAITLYPGKNIKLINAYVYNSVSGGIEIQSDNSIVENATVDTCNTGIVSIANYVNLKNCNVSNCSLFGIRIRNNSYNNVINNFVKDCSSSSNNANIELRNTNNTLLSGNTMVQTGAMTGSVSNLILDANAINNKIVNNTFTHPAEGTYYDYYTQYDFAGSVFKNNGKCKFRSFHSILALDACVEWEGGVTTVYNYATTTPTATGFNDGDIMMNKSATGYIGWVCKSGTWYPYGEIVS